MSNFHFFLWLITFHFMFIVHFISNFLLLWIMLLWTLGYKCLSESMFLAILAIYLGAELLHPMVILFNFLRNHQTVYRIFCIILIPTSNALGFQWLYIFTNTAIFLFPLIIWGLVWSSNLTGFDLHFSNGWVASPTRWTWVWVNSGSWWWTGRPGVLRFMGLQSRTQLSYQTELNWITILSISSCTWWPFLYLFGEMFIRVLHPFFSLLY